MVVSIACIRFGVGRVTAASASTCKVIKINNEQFQEQANNQLPLQGGREISRH